MSAFSKTNHYEKAFASWLEENRVKFIPVDQRKRAVFKRAKVKSFDMAISTKAGKMLIVEVKGRKFKHDSVLKASAFQSWVGMDDVDGLDGWQSVFGDKYQAVFAFAYEFEKPDVDLCGRNIYHFNGRRYCFNIISLGDYKKHMVLRSPKWRTVTLLAEDFMASSVAAEDYLLS